MDNKIRKEELASRKHPGVEYKNLKKCPKCGKRCGAPIFWGYPADMEAVMRAVDEGTLCLGGCCVTDNDPRWECTSCGHQWGRRDGL